MELIGLEQWREWRRAGEYTLFPYIRKFIPAGRALLPGLWEPAWRGAGPHSCVLESGKNGRYTIVGLEPVSVIAGKDGVGQIFEPDESKATDRSGNGTGAGLHGNGIGAGLHGNGIGAGLHGGGRGGSADEPGAAGGWKPVRRTEGPPLAQVREWLRPWKAPRPEGAPACPLGGALGFWSYDVVRSLEKLPATAADDLELPDFLFQRYERLWIADHLESAVYCVVLKPAADIGHEQDADAEAKSYAEARGEAARMEQLWTGWLEEGVSPDGQERIRDMRAIVAEDDAPFDVRQHTHREFAFSLSKEGYEEAVERIRRYIGQGDVFQVNLSVRQSKATAASPEALYEWLRLVNPSPYMGLLRTPDFALVSASPELLVKLDDGKLSTRPIAGTRRRGATSAKDAVLEAELLSNEKERAEHIMLVDLLRNDLGRVAAYGTVKVPELMTVERYSHVMHLVSQVEARLAPGKDALDVLGAAFPGGTITGAPKIRTMEIIEELEPFRRGPYTGSMGWIDYCGNMEFNIIIRTIVFRDGVCHIQAGAGIVIDSDPEREYYESLSKAKALWKAVQYGERQEERVHDTGNRQL